LQQRLQDQAGNKKLVSGPRISVLSDIVSAESASPSFTIPNPSCSIDDDRGEYGRSCVMLLTGEGKFTSKSGDWLWPLFLSAAICASLD